MNWNWVRRGSSATATATDDDWAMAKAAAWVWYKRRSDDARASLESDFGRFIRRRPPPSRYKQEATAAKTEAAAAAAADEVGPTGVAIPLLDLYEIEWITRQLERFIVGGGTRRKEAATVTASPSPPLPSTPSMAPTRKAGRKWGCHAGRICGAAGIAAAAVPLVSRRHRKAAHK